jgi:protein involved in sex pheromone biosynthesis
MMKKKLVITLISAITIILAGCTTEADTVSQNLSKSADSFEVQRRVVFFNGITDKYLLTVEGLCSLNTDSEKKLTVTCKVGEGQYKKHYLGLSDNVSYFVEQTDAKYADAYHYKVLFRPEEIIPDINIQTSK